MGQYFNVTHTSVEPFVEREVFWVKGWIGKLDTAQYRSTMEMNINRFCCWPFWELYEEELKNRTQT